MKNARKILILAILSMMSVIPLICCKSYPTEETELNWAQVPSPVDENNQPLVIFDESTDMVSMPKFYWIKIVEYISDTEANIEYLQKRKK